MQINVALINTQSLARQYAESTGEEQAVYFDPKTNEYSFAPTTSKIPAHLIKQ